MNPREEMASLMRGHFAVPIVSCLADLGILDRMRGGSFCIADFPAIHRPFFLRTIFHYLVSLGLLQTLDDERFQITVLGTKALSREGAFLILQSYRDYFDQLPRLLAGEVAPAVNRRLNVAGSGSLHRRKFFPSALELIQGETWDCAVDVGCGDGTFLSCLLREHPKTLVIAIDQSVIAIEETTRRLAGQTVRSVVADGCKIQDWVTAIPTGLKKCLVTLWFVIHEFSRGETDLVVDYFQRLSTLLPDAEVLLGEIVALPSSLLATHRHHSIMPEFLLFHALSGQGVLSWEQFHKVLEAIPYTVIAEKQFDVLLANGKPVPSSFLWHLKPKRQAHETGATT